MNHKEITNAIKNLPEEFVSPEMVMAAASEHNPQLIDILPPGMLTPEVIEAIFAGELHWNGFDLSKIPEQYRTEHICRKAVDKDRNNLRYVPEGMISREMVIRALYVDEHLHLWALVPERLWDRDIVYEIIKKSKHTRYPDERQNVDYYRILQVNLSYVPKRITNRDFWHGLLEFGVIPAKMLCEIIPSKYKDLGFYTLLATREFESIPTDKLCHELFYAAFSSGSAANTYKIMYNEQYRKLLTEAMDDKLADQIVKFSAGYFRDLPCKYQTEERLLMAVEIFKEQKQRHGFDSLTRVGEYLLTRRVCEAMIKANNTYVPRISNAYWDRDMVAFCLEHTTHFHWFEQMPKKFQTRDMVVKAVEDWRRNLEYARQDFIDKAMAEKLFREGIRNNDRYLTWLPKRYFDEFTRETGLPADFFGGGVSFQELKAHHANCTFCQIGGMYVGVYHRAGNRRDQPDSMVITRVTDGMAETLCDTALGAFHKTWLEKLVAENDPSFVKPKVDKSLRDVQGAFYYGVEHIRTENGTELYRNTFCGQTVGYCARREGITYHGDTEQAALNGLEYKIQRASDPDCDIREGDDKVLTATGLNEELGFCPFGIGIFASEYGLDTNLPYTVGELRGIIKAKGRKPSVSRYRKELSQIHLI